MGIQFREPGDVLFYSPDRDVAHIWTAVVKVAMRGLDQVAWPGWLVPFLRANSISESDLTEAASAFVKGVNRCTSAELGSFVEAFSGTGWYELRPELRVVIMARIGEVLTGVYWNGVRQLDIDDPAVIAALKKRDVENLALMLREQWSRANSSSSSDSWFKKLVKFAIRRLQALL